MPKLCPPSPQERNPHLLVEGQAPAAASKQASDKAPQSPMNNLGQWRRETAAGESGSEEEFEEDIEDDVLDRDQLKKQSGAILDKGAKKTKKKKRRNARADEGALEEAGRGAKGASSAALGAFA